jgi:AcrR family transcriptional regulator
MPAATEQRENRRRRHEETRAELVRAAVELAGEASFKDLTVDEIARAAGVSRPAFYLYFRDKEELLLSAVEEASRVMYEEADRWWHGEGEPAELVRAAVDGGARAYAENAGILRVANEVSTYDADVREFWIGLVGQFIEATAEHIRADQQRGRIDKGIDPWATAEALVWMTERCCYIFLGRGERRADEVTSSLLPVWVGALYGPRPSELV